MWENLGNTLDRLDHGDDSADNQSILHVISYDPTSLIEVGSRLDHVAKCPARAVIQ